jgi:hypothetical protein
LLFKVSCDSVALNISDNWIDKSTFLFEFEVLNMDDDWINLSNVSCDCVTLDFI